MPGSFRYWSANRARRTGNVTKPLLTQDASPTAIAEAAGVSRQVVYRVQDDPAKAEAMLAEWGM